MTIASAPHPWSGVVAAMATKHGKERQFGPALVRALDVDLIVAEVDTDRLGTFTPEVEREGTALDTLRRKARWAMSHTDARFGVASEGSFGPHPELPFLAAGVELAVFIDGREGIEVVEQLVCTDTNFSHVVVDNPEIPEAFLTSVGFPGHAVIISSGPGLHPVAKGVQDRAVLSDALASCVAAGGHALIQSDMRAHLNPTRQRALTELAERLAIRLVNRCPDCGVGGWGVVDLEKGLPCEWCGQPTELVAAECFGCADTRCGHSETMSRSGHAPAGSCHRCNP